MKISFFIGHMGQGGAERVISLLANDYARRGWDTQIAMLLKDDVEQKLDANVQLVNLNGPSDSYMKNAFFWLKAIRGYLKREKPDCVVSFIGRINALVLTAAFGAGVPIIVSERNDPRHDGRGKGMLQFCNAIYHTAKTVVFQTKTEEECFDAAVCRRGVIIPNPVSIEGVTRKEGSGFTVVTAGRLAVQKNHKMLMDAMALLRRELPEARCVIYGEGELRQELDAYLEQTQLSPTVSLPGHALDIHEKIASASVFVLTSEYEGLPNALIEAMMLGIPCITTDYPGSSEVMEDGVTGLIIPRGDAAALARTLCRLAQDPELARTLSENARAEAVKYRTENVIQAWRSVIEGA